MLRLRLRLAAIAAGFAFACAAAASTRRSILAAPEVRERMKALGADPVGKSPEFFSDFVRAEIAKWAKVVKGAGIKIE